MTYRVGCHALEEILGRAVSAAVMLHLQQIEVAASVRAQSGGVERIENDVAACVAGEEHAFGDARRDRRFGEDDDAGHVRDGIVQIVGGLGSRVRRMLRL